MLSPLWFVTRKNNSLLLRIWTIKFKKNLLNIFLIVSKSWFENLKTKIVGISFFLSIGKSFPSKLVGQVASKAQPRLNANSKQILEEFNNGNQIQSHACLMMATSYFHIAISHTDIRYNLLDGMILNRRFHDAFEVRHDLELEGVTSQRPHAPPPVPPLISRLTSGCSAGPSIPRKKKEWPFSPCWDSIHTRISRTLRLCGSRRWRWRPGPASSF